VAPPRAFHFCGETLTPSPNPLVTKPRNQYEGAGLSKASHSTPSLFDGSSERSFTHGFDVLGGVWRPLATTDGMKAHEMWLVMLPS